ncbi:MAG: extracellular solute-binding protein, partial [Streptomycetales bacterium]
MTGHDVWSRRTFLRTSGLVAAGGALAACGGSGGGGAPQAQPTAGPSPTFTAPASKLSGALRILLWCHFVPSHDTWFDKFAKDWGKQVGVDVTVDHVNVEDIPARIASEIQAGQGHDLIQFIATLSQYEPSVVDMKDVTEEANNRYGTQLGLCQKSSSNPTTGKYYAYSPGWVPDPGDFRKSLWSKAGLPNGPTTWDELLQGGTDIKKNQGIQLGLGMSQEIDSNMAGRALLWSFGGAIQDENEQVVIN